MNDDEDDQTPLVLFGIRLPEVRRLTRQAVDQDLKAAEAAGTLPESQHALIAVLRDTADRLDLLRSDPAPKATYAVVAVARTLQELYRELGIGPDRDAGSGDALDRLLEAFEEHDRIP